MGNHEWCSGCEESDFHHGRPCDPVKAAAVATRHAKAAEDEVKAVTRMKARLREVNLPYEIDEYGNALIRWIEFRT